MLPEFNFARYSTQKIANLRKRSTAQNREIILRRLFLNCDQFSTGLFKPIKQDQLNG